MSSAPQKMIALRSSDGEIFEVEETVARESQTIKHMIDDNCAATAIPLPNVTSKTLVKVIEFCKRHVYNATNAPLSDEDLWRFDAEFVRVDQETLFDLLLDANYLDIKSLFELTTKSVADMMTGKTPDQIRKIFHIKNDYTKEEEAEVRREIAWAFD